MRWRTQQLINKGLLMLNQELIEKVRAGNQQTSHRTAEQLLMLPQVEIALQILILIINNRIRNEVAGEGE